VLFLFYPPKARRAFEPANRSDMPPPLSKLS
jgi:hypothetical protein